MTSVSSKAQLIVNAWNLLRPWKRGGNLDAVFATPADALKSDDMSLVDPAAFQTGILFVCANNICRSPIAEGVFRALADRAGLDGVVVDSAGIFANHAGRPADPRAVAAASARGYDLSPIRARQVSTADFTRFQWILAMDKNNLQALAGMLPGGYAGHIGLLMDLDQGARTREVPDPYFGPRAQFDEIVQLAEAACGSLVRRLARARTP